MPRSKSDRQPRMAQAISTTRVHPSNYTVMTMVPWKDWVLSTYYHATLPFRRLMAQRASQTGRAPIMILYYHRVADDGATPWTMPCDLFRQQIEWMQPRYDMISLAEAQRRLRAGTNDQPAVSITFDDGYADNCQFAIPLLVRDRIPCTYFVSTRHVVEKIPFPHDVAIGQTLLPNSIEQLRAMANSGVEIGAHTRNHADLGKLHDLRKLEDEVVTAGHDLARALGRRVRYFAFPFGLHKNLNPAAFRLAKAAGYEAVCSAYGGYNFPGDDSFHLQRIHADNDRLRIRNWLTVDPRKLAIVQRYHYEDAIAATRRQELTAT